MSAERPPVWRRWPVAADVTVVGGIATVFTLIGLGSKSLWLDEGYSAVLADTRGAHNFIHAWVYGDPNSTLYYLLLHLWSYLGTSEVALRSLSVVFAVAGAVMTYVLGKDLFGRATGVTAGVLVGLNSFAVSFGQSVRGYSALLFFSAASTYLLLLVLRDDRRRFWLGYGVVTTAGYYVHYFMAMVIGVHVIYLVLTRTSRPALRRAASGLLTTVVLASPIVVHAARASQSGISWIPPTKASEVWHLAGDLAGGNPMLPFALMALAFVAVLAARSRKTPDGHALLLIALGVVVPVAGGVFASAVLRPLLVYRYFIECVPFVAIMLATAIWRLPRRSISIAAIAVATVLSLDSVKGWYDQGSLENWRAASQYIASTAPPDTQVVEASYFAPLEYYLNRDAPALVAPIEAESYSCHFTPDASCFDSAHQVDVVSNNGGNEAAAKQVLLSLGYTVTGTRTFIGSIVVTLYSRT